MPEGGFIYAISAVGTPYVKIGGTAGAVQARRTQLQVGCPFPLCVVATVPIDHDLWAIERHVHALLVETGCAGEWFALTLDDEKLAVLVHRARTALAPCARPSEDASAPVDAAFRRDLGRHLRHARERRGWSHRDVARRMGCAVRAILRLETGAGLPQAKTVHRLAAILETSVDYLVGFTDDYNPPKKPPRARKVAPVG